MYDKCVTLFSAFLFLPQTQMKAGLLKLDLYRNSLKYYLEFGTWCDHVLCLYLKKIYRKVNVTMDPFREAPLVVPGKEPTPPPEQESEVEEDEV